MGGLIRRKFGQILRGLFEGIFGGFLKREEGLGRVFRRFGFCLGCTLDEFVRMTLGCSFSRIRTQGKSLSEMVRI